MPGSRVIREIVEIARKAGLTAVSVAFYDYETALYFSYQGDRWFHAASTMKVAVLMGVFHAAGKDLLKLDDRLHVRNRFVSRADGSIYRVDSSRDGDPELFRRLGRAARIIDLARLMITRSSNLATNLLLDFIGIDFVRRLISDAGVSGVRIRRGVEDHVAFERGINNEITAEGLLGLFRLLCGNDELFSPSARQQMLEILFAQEFNSMIPARLPTGVRVAHKTGEISTACHDAGIVQVAGRKPYVLAVLTESPPNTEGRQKAVASISSLVFNYLGESREEIAPTPAAPETAA